MRAPKLASAVAAFALAASLVACGGGPASYGHELLDEADGIRVTAENADSTHTATTEGALEVEAGDVIIISPFLDKGSIHVTITSKDGKTTVYDADAEGKVMYDVQAAPGTYNVTTTANNATGWVTIFAQSAQELADQNASLVEELKNKGVDDETVKMFEDNAAASEVDDDKDDTDDKDDKDDQDDALEEELEKNGVDDDAIELLDNDDDAE